MAFKVSHIDKVNARILWRVYFSIVVLARKNFNYVF